MKTICNFFLVFILTQLLAGCEKNEDQPKLASVSKIIDPYTNAQLSVTNSKGDNIVLVFPKNSLYEPTEITLKLIDYDPTNLFSKCLVPGIEILPENLELKNPATLQIFFASGIDNEELTQIFYLDEPDIAYPLSRPQIIGNMLQGEIYHFSQYFSSEITINEIIDMYNKIFSNETIAESSNKSFQELFTKVNGLVVFAEMLQEFGYDELASKILDFVKEIFTKDAEKFIKKLVPDDPCNEYLHSLFKYHEQAILFGCNNDLLEKFDRRTSDIVNTCTFSGSIEYKIKQECTKQWINSSISENGTINFKWHDKNYIPVIGDGEYEVTFKQTDTQCTMSSYGLGDLEATGIFYLDENQEPWIEFTIKLEGMSMEGSTVCPDETISYSGFWEEDELKVKLRMEDGYTINESFQYEGCNGTVEYIIDIKHLN